jgi:hypothetical protein
LIPPESPSMQDIIKTLFTRSWLLALAGAAVIGAQPVSAQTAADSKHDRTVRSRIALAQVLPNLDAGWLQVKLVEVTYPPGGFSAPHTPPFPVVVYVIAGALRVALELRQKQPLHEPFSSPTLTVFTVTLRSLNFLSVCYWEPYAWKRSPEILPFPAHVVIIP